MALNAGVIGLGNIGGGVARNLAAAGHQLVGFDIEPARIAEAGAQDIVLIAGKGHETGQIIGSGENMRVLPFDDVEVARECAAQIARGDA